MKDLSRLLSEKLSMFKWQGGEWAGSLCPFPDHHDVLPSFRINMEKGFFTCFGCQRSGSIAELLVVLGLPAANIEDLVSAIKFIKTIKREKTTEVLPEYILAAFRRCPKTLLAGGFSKDILKENDIGFDLTNHCVTYPLRDKNGILSAIYRRTNSAYKYLVYDFKEFEGYAPAPKKHLWGLHKVYAKYASGGDIKPLVVTEGFKACLWVMQHGFNSVATMGTMMTKDQVGLLSLLDAPTIFMFDNNEPGQKGTILAYRKLREKIADIKFCSYPKEQPDGLTETELVSAIEEPETYTQWRKQCPTTLLQKWEKAILTRGTKHS